jgi:4-hydroxy-2-oxoheptanedioate aldolase
MNFKELKRLKASLKISLEDEGLTFDQAVQLTSLAHKNGIDVTMKIGGAEAISDMRFASNIGCSGCVAPMVESSYALHKFISSNHKYPFDFQHLYINIESEQAYKNIKSILTSSDAKYLHGIVLGRTDFIQSFGLTKDKVDSAECLEMATEIFTLAKECGLVTLMGGNVNTNSKVFVEELYNQSLLDYIETRNVKVKITPTLLNNFADSLSAMLTFEAEWLEKKYKTLDQLSREDKNRCENLKTRGK